MRVGDGSGARDSTETLTQPAASKTPPTPADRQSALPRYFTVSRFAGGPRYYRSVRIAVFDSAPHITTLERWRPRLAWSNFAGCVLGLLTAACTAPQRHAIPSDRSCIPLTSCSVRPASLRFRVGQRNHVAPGRSGHCRASRHARAFLEETRFLADPDLDPRSRGRNCNIEVG